MAKACETRYRIALPAGASEAKPATAIRLDVNALRPFDRAYACVVATISASGDMQGARIAEADPQQFGEYLLQVVKRTRFVHGTAANGEPLETTVVVTATTIQSGGRGR
jgi:hypothetical protein